jgi:drug/metabolite transporter (DMT)-like permease
MSRIGVIRCSVAAVLFGLSAPAASRLADEMGAFTLAGLLYLGAALGVVPFVGRTPPSRAAVRRAVPGLVTAVVLGGAVGPVLLAAGLGLVPPATASLLLNLELVFTTVLAGLAFREHLGRPVLAGTALVLAGSLALGWTGEPDLRWGAVVIAGACLCWAVDNCVTATIDQIAPSHVTLVKGTVAGAANVAIGLLAGDHPAPRAVAGALVIGVFGYGASITLWVAGARELGAARGQLVFATAPFVGAGASWAVLGDTVAPREIVAFVLGAAGIAGVLRSAHEHEHGHESVEHDHEHAHDEHHPHHGAEPVLARHAHPHAHPAGLMHRHPHVPDLHHRHGHD